MFRVLLTSTALFVTAHTALAVSTLPIQEEDPTHPQTLRVHFKNVGATIDRETFQKAVNAAESEMNHFDTYSLLNWGTKGQHTICLQPKFEETFDAYQRFYSLLAQEGRGVEIEVIRAECPLQQDLD